ncbi:hypothetical protein EI534_03050 [Pseudomonas frederiksbergensis]|nr:hypothetical protein [Pseudomonas frederiksbergensis]
MKMLAMPTTSRASPLPQFFAVFAELVYTMEPVGAGLARDSGGSANEDVGCAGVIASKPAPTVFRGVLKTGHKKGAPKDAKRFTSYQRSKELLKVNLHKP